MDGARKEGRMQPAKDREEEIEGWMRSWLE